MTEPARGISVFCNPDGYIVLFPHQRHKYYPVGGLLFELFGNEAYYTITENVAEIIRTLQNYKEKLTVQSVAEMCVLLYHAIEDEPYPVAAELFRCSFTKALFDISDQPALYEDCTCLGDFLMKVYAEYNDNMEGFALLVEAIAADASGMADDLDRELAAEFLGIADGLYASYTKKTNVRTKKDAVHLNTYLITSTTELLIFEYSRLKKKNKIIKQCKNCNRYFIPKGRKDATYCFLPSPQNPDKTCAEIGPQLARIERRRSDPLEREHNRRYSQLAMAARRARENKCKDIEDEMKRRLNEEMNRYNAAKYPDEHQEDNDE